MLKTTYYVHLAQSCIGRLNCHQLNTESAHSKRKYHIRFQIQLWNSNNNSVIIILCMREKADMVNINNISI